MQGTRLTALFALLCLLLSGCQRSGEVENQAYVLALGVDQADDGGLELTARVPKIGKEDGGGDPCLTFTAYGEDWQSSLEALQLATPRQVNLSHICLLAVSEALVREVGFPGIIADIAETPHLYATTPFVVCRDSAGGFVEAQETVLGTRMSAELSAMFRHYVQQGYIPDSSLAEVYYASNTFYSDPVAIYASLDDESAPMAQRYSGAAVFREGRLAMVLSLEQTQLLSLILGSASACTLDKYELAPTGPADRRVDITPDGARLYLEMQLASRSAIERGEVADIEERLEREIKALIAACQAASVDPFGFSEAAVRHFATIPDWLSSGWREKYAVADVTVRVRLSPSNS